MSSFGGQLKEFPGICIDNFLKPNNETTAYQLYILSHAHSDHWKGFFDTDFQQRLAHSNEENPVEIICTDVTLWLMETWAWKRQGVDFEPIRRRVQTCQVDESDPLETCTVDDEGNQVYVSIRFLSAGHMPGSCMVLIESEKTNVLYTGDFRFDSEQRFDEFKHRTNDLSIDTLYLDTTFANVAQIPTRQNSIDTLIRFIKSRGSAFQAVHLSFPSDFGYELLLLQLFYHFKAIHCDEQRKNKYNHANFKVLIKKFGSSFYDCLTTNATADPPGPLVHICRPERQLCPALNQLARHKILNVKVSAMYFTEKAFNFELLSCDDQASPFDMRLFFSTHSSFSELERFCRHLKPKSIVPCVVPAKLKAESSEFSRIVRRLQSGK